MSTLTQRMAQRAAEQAERDRHRYPELVFCVADGTETAETLLELERTAQRLGYKEQTVDADVAAAKEYRLLQSRFDPAAVSEAKVAYFAANAAHEDAKRAAVDAAKKKQRAFGDWNTLSRREQGLGNYRLAHPHLFPRQSVPEPTDCVGLEHVTEDGGTAPYAGRDGSIVEGDIGVAVADE